MRYEMRLLENGWAVWDAETNTPAVVKDGWQVSLTLDDADDLTDLMTMIDQKFEKNPPVYA